MFKDVAFETGLEIGNGSADLLPNILYLFFEKISKNKYIWYFCTKLITEMILTFRNKPIMTSPRVDNILTRWKVKPK